PRSAPARRRRDSPEPRKQAAMARCVLRFRPLSGGCVRFEFMERCGRLQAHFAARGFALAALQICNRYSNASSEIVMYGIVSSKLQRANLVVNLPFRRKRNAFHAPLTLTYNGKPGQVGRTGRAPFSTSNV